MSTLRALGSSGLSLPPDSYIYQLLPLTAQISHASYAALSAGSNLAALSSNNAVTIIDASSLQPSATLDKVSASVTCMARFALPGQECTTILTTGRDGHVRIWDLRTGKLAGEATASLERLGKQSLSALAANANTNAIIAGTELWEREGPGDAPIFVWDARKLDVPHHLYTESHTDTITDLRFHPSQENILLTASTDGLVNLINVSDADEDEAVLQVINHKSALHHAGMLSDELVYGLGTDETLRLYAVENPDDDSPAKAPIVLGDMREALDVEYVVDVYPGAAGVLPYIVGGKHSAQTLDFIPLVQSSEALKPDLSAKIRIDDAHGEEIVRDVYVDADVTFTCGEDGMVRAWKRPNEEGMGINESGEGKGKKDKRSKVKEGRYAPY